jgi:hypothetical protein
MKKRAVKPKPAMYRGRAGTLLTGTGALIGCLAMTLHAQAPPVLSAQGQPIDTAAIRWVNRAIDLMGGEEKLRGIHRTAMSMMTQWQRTGFREIPYTDRPSFERHHDVRDYTIPAWRNTRQFGSRDIVNIVRDSVSATNFGTGFQPLNIAYVDERAELFAYTPDRLMLFLRDAPDLRVGRDTSIGGESHRVVTATVADRFPSQVYFHAGTGLPTVLRFRAAQANDFGLVPWGEMQVSVWYSNWRTMHELSIPTQWDIERVGQPYKRMTVLSIELNPEFAPDSFEVAANTRASYFQTAARPMHETRGITATQVVEPGLVVNEGFGFPAGAVEVGGEWLMIGAGQASYNFRMGVEALTSAGVRTIAGVLALTASTGNGGVLAAADAGLPIYVSPASEPFVRKMLEGSTRHDAEIIRVPTGGFAIEFGEERLQLKPIDLPNVAGSVMLYRPETGWLYLPDAVEDLDMRIGQQQAQQADWDIRSTGNARRLWPN